MTAWILKTLSEGKQNLKQQNLATSRPQWTLLLFVISLIVSRQIDTELFDIVVNTLSDAYIAVSIFVALTLAGFYALDKYFKASLTRFLNQSGFMQVPVAAFLGALPGCGGAIIVVTQFVHGQISFGALVAVLIATMGDAAFLLVSQKPTIALYVYGLSIIAGILSGYIINGYHGQAYMKPAQSEAKPISCEIPKIPKTMVGVFLALLVPGSILGVLAAFQFDTDRLLGIWSTLEPTKWLGFFGALLCISIWANQPLNSWTARFAKKNEVCHVRETVVAETSFISVWVIVGFLAYELLVYFTGVDLQAQFLYLGALAPLLAIVIGFVPGCGPQILVTTLYVNGVIPLSSLVANAISNDGDALFPAIALAPKAAIKATVYSAVPAFILGYAMFFAGW